MIQQLKKNGFSSLEINYLSTNIVRRLDNLLKPCNYDVICHPWVGRNDSIPCKSGSLSGSETTRAIPQCLFTRIPGFGCYKNGSKMSEWLLILLLLRLLTLMWSLTLVCCSKGFSPQCHATFFPFNLMRKRR